MPQSSKEEPLVGWIDRLVQTSRRSLLAVSALLLVSIAFLDWVVVPDISLVILFVFPVWLAAFALSKHQVIALGIVCAILCTLLSVSISPADTVVRFLVAAVAFGGSGLFVSEFMRNRKLVIAHVRESERQQEALLEVEEHLRSLAESSPAAVFTLDEHVRVLSANEATRELFRLPKEMDLRGQHIAKFLPVLADAIMLNVTSSAPFRTAAQCQGRCWDGTVFVAQTWFSTYLTPQGNRLAAIAVDCSEEIREREQQNLQQLREYSRIVAGAVSHEIRNVCSAISVIHSNLRNVPDLDQNEDFRALGSLVSALGNIASAELQARARRRPGAVDLREILSHVRIIIEPSFQEIGGIVTWDVPSESLLVLADAFGLIQSFLNLAQNSHRAVLECEKKELRIMVIPGSIQVLVVFEDTGVGVREPEELFQPFQAGSSHAGLGLYVSRALLRSYGGDLRFEALAKGCRFVAELPVPREREGSPSDGN